MVWTQLLLLLLFGTIISLIRKGRKELCATWFTRIIHSPAYTANTSMCVCVCVQSVECEMRQECARCALHTCHVNFVSSRNIQSINNIVSFSFVQFGSASQTRTSHAAAALLAVARSSALFTSLTVALTLSLNGRTVWRLFTLHLHTVYYTSK